MKKVMQPCLINPKTEKPYSKHKFAVDNLRVIAYDAMGRPMQYAYEAKCERCGYNAGVVRY